MDRRKFGRHHYEIRGYNLYRDENWLALPQKVIRAVLLSREKLGTWVPQYPSASPVRIGDDLALALIEEERLRKLA